MHNVRIKELLIVFYCIILFPTIIYAKDKDDSTETFIQSILEEFYKIDENIHNSPNLELDWGISFLNLPGLSLENELAKAFITELKYGFTRIDERLDVKNRLYYASDNFFVGNVSSHMRPESWKISGITTDSWRFGYSYRNGYGYILGKEVPFILYHAGSLMGSKVDIENPPKGKDDIELLDKFDIKYKFGSSFEGGIKSRLYKIIHFHIAYEHSLVFPDFNITKWLGSTLVEFVPQRIIDLASEELLVMYPDTYPVINFVVKNAISVLLYEFRRTEMFFPFESEAPLNYNTFRMGIALIF